MASGANCIADEIVKPHMRIPLGSQQSAWAQCCVPSSGSHPSPTCLESSHLKFQVKVRSNWTKKSFLNTKEAALHDDFKSTSNCSLRKQEGPNQILVWTKRSLGSSCATPKSLYYTMTPRRSTHIVGPASVVPKLDELVVPPPPHDARR